MENGIFGWFAAFNHRDEFIFGGRWLYVLPYGGSWFFDGIVENEDDYMAMSGDWSWREVEIPAEIIDNTEPAAAYMRGRTANRRR